MAVQKTPITILQEMMVKLGGTAEYECCTQAGPDHCKAFEYKCVAQGLSTSAWARSKKEAKQEAARLMLNKLNLTDEDQELPAPPPTSAEEASKSNVILLKELCEHYHLPMVEYELVGDSGPAHQRQFTVRVKMAQTERSASATTKKMARQRAAAALYSYLREHLSNYTKDFNETDAMVRAHEKIMNRYQEIKEANSWKPDLGQKISEYHLGIVNHIEEKKCNEARKLLKEGPSEAVLERVCKCLGLSLEWDELEGANGAALPLLELTPTSPPLAFSDTTRAGVVENAFDYLQLALQFAPTKTVLPLQDEDQDSSDHSSC